MCTANPPQNEGNDQCRMCSDIRAAHHRHRTVDCPLCLGVGTLPKVVVIEAELMGLFLLESGYDISTTRACMDLRRRHGLTPLSRHSDECNAAFFQEDATYWCTCFDQASTPKS